MPCFLINLADRASKSDVPLKGDAGDYVWNGGVGPKGQFMAIVAICNHQLSYPQPELSHPRFAAEGSELAGGPGKIVCCAHASVFDSTEGGSGPATPPAAAGPPGL